MLLLLDIDRYYTLNAEEAKTLQVEKFLDKPILEIALDFPCFKRELALLKDSNSSAQLKYLLIKSALEVDRCLKVSSALQKHKVTASAQIFAEVMTTK